MPRRDARGSVVIETRRAQRRFADGLIAAEVADLREAWMRQADRVLDDPQIVAAVCTRLWRSVIPTVAGAAGAVPRPRWCCGRQTAPVAPSRNASGGASGPSPTAFAECTQQSYGAWH